MISEMILRYSGLLLTSFMVIQLSACDSNEDVDLFVQAEEVAALGLTSLSLSSSVSLLNSGETAQFTVTGEGSGAAKITDLSSKVKWKSSNEGLATVNDTGLVTAIADGVVSITARYAYLQTDSELTISTADLVQISLNGDLLVDECKTTDITAKGIFSDGSTRIIASGISWTVSDTTIASVTGNADNSATLMTHKPGLVSVRASKTQITGVHDVEVKDALQELIVSPAQGTVSIGNTVNYGATGVYQDAETTDITASTIWSSLDSDIAAFDGKPNGTLLAKKEGSTSIVGRCGELSTNATVTVNKVTLSHVYINNNKTSLTLDEDDDGYQLTLRATYNSEPNDVIIDVTDDAEWSNITNASGNIVVSNDDDHKGELAITGTGSATIEAEYEGKTDTIIIVVE